jgi:hypothetical protein
MSWGITHSGLFGAVTLLSEVDSSGKGIYWREI